MNTMNSNTHLPLRERIRLQLATTLNAPPSAEQIEAALREHLGDRYQQDYQRPERPCSRPAPAEARERTTPKRKPFVGGPISLGNGGTYFQGHTHYAFRPCRWREVGAPYRQVEISFLGKAWAWLEDGGEDVEARTLRDEYGTVTHVQPRFCVRVLGWGSDTVSSDGLFWREDFEAAEWQRLKQELEA